LENGTLIKLKSAKDLLNELAIKSKYQGLLKNLFFKISLLMKIGYARVSTKDQNLALQLDALKNAGCERVFQEKESAGKERPEYEQMKSILRSGDTVVVWKLDRIGRSLKDLVGLIESFKENNISFVSLQDPVDTTTSQGRLVFNMFACLAEYERELTRERTKAGLASARARGRKGGRPTGLSEDAKRKAKLAASLYQKNEMSVGEILKTLNLSKTALYRYLRLEGVQIQGFTKTKKI